MHRALSTLRRVVIEAVDPEVDGGKFPIKRCLGDRVRMQADIFADGHDLLGARLLFRRVDDSEWRGAGRGTGANLTSSGAWGAEFAWKQAFLRTGTIFWVRGCFLGEWMIPSGGKLACG